MTAKEVAHFELRRLAEAILASEALRLEDLRRLAGLGYEVGHEDEPEFHFIRGTVSDLDSVPDESRRKLYSEEFLAESDAACLDYLRDSEASVKACCRRLLSSLWLRQPTLLDVLESRLSDATGVWIPGNRNPGGYIKELAESIREHSCEPFQVQAIVEEPGFPDLAVGQIIAGWCVAAHAGAWLVYQTDEDRFCCFWGMDSDHLSAPGIFGSPLSCWFT